MGHYYTLVTPNRTLKTLVLSRIPQLDAFQYQLQLCPVQYDFVSAARAILEPTLLQTLRPDTVTRAVKIQYLHLCALAVYEHKQVTTCRIFMQCILDQR